MTSEGARILIVDDEADVREMLQRTLVRSGHECATASGPAEAASLLQRQEFELVILDVLMPERSGMQFLPELLARYPDVAVIMLSAVADSPTAVMAMREGASDYVTKPINLSRLGTHITRALDRRAGMTRTRDYRRNLESMVAERGADAQQRMREITALNNLVRSHIRQAIGTEESYNRLQTTLADFSTQLETLAQQAKVIASEGARTLAGLEDQPEVGGPEQ